MLVDDRCRVARIAHEDDAISRQVLSLFVLLVRLVRFGHLLLLAHVGQVSFDILALLLLLLEMVVLLLGKMVSRRGRAGTAGR